MFENWTAKQYIITVFQQDLNIIQIHCIPAQKIARTKNLEIN